MKKRLCGGCNLNFFLAKGAYAFLIYFNVIQLISNNRLVTKVNMYKELTHNTEAIHTSVTWSKWNSSIVDKTRLKSLSVLCCQNSSRISKLYMPHALKALQAHPLARINFAALHIVTCLGLHWTMLLRFNILQKRKERNDRMIPRAKTVKTQLQKTFGPIAQV